MKDTTSKKNKFNALPEVGKINVTSSFGGDWSRLYVFYYFLLFTIIVNW